MVYILRSASQKKKRRVGVCAALCLWRAAGPRQGRRPPPRPCRTAAKGRLRFLSVASGNKDTRVCVGLTADAG